MPKVKKSFKKNEIPVSSNVFDQAIQSLLDKGLVETIDVNGDIHYRLTTLGLQIQNHLNSDPSQRN